MRVHSITKGTRSNGPGLRNILHVQGCSLHCPGCFSPHTWDAAGGRSMEPARVADLLLEDNPEGGVTISGGEPMEQAWEVLHTIHHLKKRRPDCSIIMYTGWELKRLLAMMLWANFSRNIDAVVVGPYDRSCPTTGRGLLSSGNQQLLRTSDRYSDEQLTRGGSMVEVRVDHQVTMMGFPSRKLIRDLRMAAGGRA